MHQTWPERERGNGEQISRGVGRVGTMAAVNSRDKNRLEKRSLQNGSDHAVVASYSGLYEECDVEHINVFGLVFYTRQLVFCSEF